MSTNTYITIAVAMMVNAVVFGIGAITVLSIPALSENAKYLIPAVVIVTFCVTPFIARRIAPRLRLRYWRERGELGA